MQKNSAATHQRCTTKTTSQCKQKCAPAAGCTNTTFSWFFLLQKNCMIKHLSVHTVSTVLFRGHPECTKLAKIPRTDVAKTRSYNITTYSLHIHNIAMENKATDTGRGNKAFIHTHRQSAIKQRDLR